MKRVFSVFGFIWMVLLSNAQEKAPRNIISVESNLIMSTHFSYDRIMTSINDKSSLTLGVDYIMGTGFGFGTHWIAPEINLFSFGPKHYLGTGILYSMILHKSEEEADSDYSPGIKMAYQYQADKGFIFRASLYALFATDPPVFPTIGMGYAF